MKNKKILLFLLLALGVAGTIGVVSLNAVSAHGWVGWGKANLDPQEVVTRQNQMFSNQADLLGISIDKVKGYWAQGKSIMEIIEDLGISQEDLQAKMKTAREEQVKKELQILVAGGVITQAQADARLKVILEREGKMANGKFGHRMGGMGMGMAGFMR